MKDPQVRLARLRRLRERHASGYLGTVTESTAEQSWNEQLFAGVLGYQTLLSHDRLPFHLRPKTYNTDGRYDDFSLGFFGIAGHERRLVSAELKGAGANLDGPQKGGSYKGMSAVEQALNTARAVSSYRWVIVSNLTELRLYAVDDDEPLAVALLPEITNARDLARLCALFDSRALLGDHGDDADMVMALNNDENHPSMPLPKMEGCYRVIFRFTPAEERRVPLFEVEETLRAITRKDGSDRWLRPSNRDPDDDFPAAVDDGWVAIDSEVPVQAQRIAMSTLGEVQVTWRKKLKGKQVSHFGGIAAALKLGTEVVQRGLAKPPQPSQKGLVTAELRDVMGASMLVNDVDTYLRTETNYGVTKKDVLLAGDFEWANVIGHVARACAQCLCELAIQFRDDTGGVAFRPDAVESKVFSDLEQNMPMLVGDDR